MAMATGTSLNKRLNEQNDEYARAFRTEFINRIFPGKIPGALKAVQLRNKRIKCDDKIESALGSSKIGSLGNDDGNTNDDG